MSAKKETPAMLIAALVLSIPLAIWRAFVFAHFWRWFAVNALGLPPISTAQAFGLLTLLAFATFKPRDLDGDVGEMLFRSAVYNLVAYLFGVIAALILGVTS